MEILERTAREEVQEWLVTLDIEVMLGHRVSQVDQAHQGAKEAKGCKETRDLPE